MSEARLNRLAFAAGVRQGMRSRRRPPSRPRTVIVTPALRDALLAWCAAPTTRTVLGVLVEAVSRVDRRGRG